MRTLVAALLSALLVLASLSAPALAYDTPRATVEAIYAPYQAGDTHADLRPFYSQRLVQLFDLYEQGERLQSVAYGEGAATGLSGFNPFLPGKNARLFDLVITDPVEIDGRALVNVRFQNFGHPTLLSIALVREGDGWKVDDVASMDADEHWMLTWLLQYDPWRAP